jgi:hypothetical protein
MESSEPVHVGHSLLTFQSQNENEYLQRLWQLSGHNMENIDAKSKLSIFKEWIKTELKNTESIDSFINYIIKNKIEDGGLEEEFFYFNENTELLYRIPKVHSSVIVSIAAGWILEQFATRSKNIKISGVFDESLRPINIENALDQLSMVYVPNLWKANLLEFYSHMDETTGNVPEEVQFTLDIIEPLVNEQKKKWDYLKSHGKKSRAIAFSEYRKNNFNHIPQDPAIRNIARRIDKRDVNSINTGGRLLTQAIIMTIRSLFGDDKLFSPQIKRYKNYSIKEIALNRMGIETERGKEEAKRFTQTGEEVFFILFPLYYLSVCSLLAKLSKKPVVEYETIKDITVSRDTQMVTPKDAFTIRFSSNKDHDTSNRIYEAGHPFRFSVISTSDKTVTREKDIRNITFSESLRSAIFSGAQVDRTKMNFFIRIMDAITRVLSPSKQIQQKIKLDMVTFVIHPVLGSAFNEVFMSHFMREFTRIEPEGERGEEEEEEEFESELSSIPIIGGQALQYESIGNNTSFDYSDMVSLINYNQDPLIVEGEGRILIVEEMEPLPSLSNITDYYVSVPNSPVSTTISGLEFIEDEELENMALHSITDGYYDLSISTDFGDRIYNRMIENIDDYQKEQDDVTQILEENARKIREEKKKEKEKKKKEEEKKKKELNRTLNLTEEELSNISLKEMEELKEKREEVKNLQEKMDLLRNEISTKEKALQDFVNELNNKVNAFENEKNTLQNMIESLKKEKKTLQNDKNKSETTITQYSSRINTLEKELQTCQDNIDDTKNRSAYYRSFHSAFQNIIEIILDNEDYTKQADMNRSLFSKFKSTVGSLAKYELITKKKITEDIIDTRFSNLSSELTKDEALKKIKEAQKFYPSYKLNIDARSELANKISELSSSPSSESLVPVESKVKKPLSTTTTTTATPSIIIKKKKKSHYYQKEKEKEKQSQQTDYNFVGYDYNLFTKSSDIKVKNTSSIFVCDLDSILPSKEFCNNFYTGGRGKQSFSSIQQASMAYITRGDSLRLSKLEINSHYDDDDGVVDVSSVRLYNNNDAESGDDKMSVSMNNNNNNNNNKNSGISSSTTTTTKHYGHSFYSSVDYEVPGAFSVTIPSSHEEIEEIDDIPEYIEYIDSDNYDDYDDGDPWNDPFNSRQTMDKKYSLFNPHESNKYSGKSAMRSYSIGSIGGITINNNNNDDDDDNNNNNNKSCIKNKKRQVPTRELKSAITMTIGGIMAIVSSRISKKSKETITTNSYDPSSSSSINNNNSSSKRKQFDPSRIATTRFFSPSCQHIQRVGGGQIEKYIMEIIEEIKNLWKPIILYQNEHNLELLITMVGNVINNACIFLENGNTERANSEMNHLCVFFNLSDLTVLTLENMICEMYKAIIRFRCYGERDSMKKCLLKAHNMDVRFNINLLK